MSDFAHDLVALCRHFGVFERDRVCCGTVTVQQCIVLQALLDGPAEVLALAQAVGSSPSAMTRLVDGLAKRDWVERVRSDEDRRRVNVHLTDEGRAEAERLQNLTDSAMRAVMGRIPADKRDQVIESLGLVVAALDDARGAAGCC